MSITGAAGWPSCLPTAPKPFSYDEAATVVLRDARHLGAGDRGNSAAWRPNCDAGSLTARCPVQEALEAGSACCEPALCRFACGNADWAAIGGR